MSEPPELGDEALGRRLATELPRHGAPPEMRAAVLRAVAGPSRPAVWLAAAASAAATALALLLFFVPTLPRGAGEPAERLARAVVAEHVRTLTWGARRVDVIPAALPWLAQETGIGLARAFPGDEALKFVAAQPVYVEKRRGLALHYRSGDGHLVTYVTLPAPGLQVPQGRRVQVDRWRPALLRDNGYAVWVWKEGDLACFIVSDEPSAADLESFKEYFVRLRLTTQPVRAD